MSQKHSQNFWKIILQLFGKTVFEVLRAMGQYWDPASAESATVEKLA